MKILVTGSTGFIGFHCSKKLLDDGFEVLGIDNMNDYYDPQLKDARLAKLECYDNFIFKKVNIADKKQLSFEFEFFHPDKVVHLAAQAGVRYSIENPYAYLDANLNGFLNILELCRQNSVEGLIYASSSSIYGANTKIPFSIDDRTDCPVSLYGATKKANELMAYSYSHLYGLKTTGLRFFTVYGPWGRPDMAYYLFTDKILKEEYISVFNNGNMRRDFTYIDDIIVGIRSAIKNNYPCEVFNLGNNKSEHLMDLIGIIEKVLEKKAKINFQPMQIGDVPESFADIDKSTERLHYMPTTNIDEGIPRFIHWYKEYYKI